MCTDLIKGKLTPKEARRNLREIVDDITEEHYDDVVAKIEILEKEND